MKKWKFYFIVFLLYQLLFLSYIPLYALNRGQIRDIIRDLVRDANSNSNKQHWLDTEINQYINLAQEEIVSLTWCQKNYYDITISSKYAVYTITDTIFTVTRVVLNNKSLEETTLQKLDANNSQWNVNISSSEPTKYYVYQSSNTNLKIGFYPPPDKQYTVTIYYFENASELSSDNDIPFRGLKKLYPYHYLICLWVASQLSAIDENPGMASFYYNLYIERLKAMQKDINSKPNYFPTVQGKRF